jgi:hypothetical protein
MLTLHICYSGVMKTDISPLRLFGVAAVVAGAALMGISYLVEGNYCNTTDAFFIGSIITATLILAAGLFLVQRKATSIKRIALRTLIAGVPAIIIGFLVFWAAFSAGFSSCYVF